VLAHRALEGGLGIGQIPARRFKQAAASRAGGEGPWATGPCTAPLQLIDEWHGFLPALGRDERALVATTT
jgi:hypothetical protein